MGHDPNVGHFVGSLANLYIYIYIYIIVYIIFYDYNLIINKKNCHWVMVNF